MVPEDKVVALLGQGYPATIVAQAVGCTPSYITQLLELKPHLKDEVTRLGIQRLSRAQTLDDAYDVLEEKLLKKLNDSVVFMTNPRDIANTLARVNAAKRRGQLSQDNLGLDSSDVSKISLPSVIINQFIVNGNNQVVQAGDQTLVTMPSNGIAGMATKALENINVLENKPSGKG
jgi:hypothetical protein